MVSEMVVVWLSEPDVPVTVMVLVPVVAVLVAVKVRTLVDVVGLVPNEAVTPLGRVEVESDTDPVKPPDGATVTVLAPLAPCFTVKLAGEAESEKSGVAVAFTVSVTVTVCDVLPLVPVTVSVYVPAGVEALVETVSAEDPEPPVTGFGLKLEEAPEGNPLRLNDTLPVKPLLGFTVMV